MSGSPTPATSTTTVNNPGQQELYKLGLPFLKEFAAKPPQLPSGPTVAGFDPAQTAGQEAILGATGTQQNLVGSGANTAQFLSGDVLYPGSNPALSEYQRTATQPLYQNLTENVLPAIRGAAETTGNFGSSRQGIAEGLAAGRTAQAAGNVTADIANKGYQSGLDALVKNLALLPQTTQAQLIPGLSTSGVGDVRQQLTQQLLGETNLRELYPQLLPLLMGQSLIGTGSSIQPAGTTTTAQSSQSNPVMQGLGLGISGLGALGGGTGIAALLPFLSDRRLKRNITRCGTVNGVSLYRFQYKRGTDWHVGVMADEVPPAATLDFCGFKLVNYMVL